MMRKNFLILNILILLIFSISGCVEETTKTATFMDKVEDSNTIPADFIPKQNLPGNLILKEEVTDDGVYINATILQSAFYRSENGKSFCDVGIAKYFDETIAKENFNILVQSYIEGFELMNDKSIFRETEDIKINEINIQKYTTVVLGTKDGATINLYAWQVGNYGFIVSGGSTDYKGDISLDLTKYILESKLKEY